MTTANVPASMCSGTRCIHRAPVHAPSAAPIITIAAVDQRTSPLPEKAYSAAAEDATIVAMDVAAAE